MEHKRKVSRYNQQFFRDWGGAGPMTFGVIAVLLVALGMYLAFTKSIPFTSPGYEVKATFGNAVNIAIKSPVRIAGVNVGKVTKKEGAGNNTVVSFTVDPEGRPIHEDASAQIRPRLFLEGNWFIDLDPGTPGSPEIDEDGTIPIARTSTSVQIGDVLRTLQIPERANIQKLLVGLGTGLNKKPTAEQDLTFEPSVQGLSGGEALNVAYQSGEEAARGTAVVAEATLGEGPNDLGNLLRGLSRVTAKVNQRGDDLQGFIRNFEVFTGALAAESNNLGLTIQELGPTLQTARVSLASLNAALPALRGFAIAITPGFNEIPRTIRVATPFTNQVKALLTKRELGGLAKIAKRSTPASAKSINATLLLLPQLRNVALCVAENIVPTGDQVIQDGSLGNGQAASREFLYSTVGAAGATQSFDANGPLTRFQVGGGPVSVKMNDPLYPGNSNFETLYGRTETPPLGTTPSDNGQPPLVGNQLCHNQDVPDLNGENAQPGAPSPATYTP
ncbi:MAG: MCE family protein [Thermoleophilia bacterium]|nr:MCE family protein [Thermoleophilia bacterium]